MKPPFPSCRPPVWVLTSWLVLGLVGFGCSSPKMTLPEFGPRFIPSNVQKTVLTLPQELKRIAVLPLTVELDNLAAMDRIDSMTSLFEEELRKQQRFEVISVSPANLQRWFGRPRILATESVPADLLSHIKTNLLADGILFVRVHSYRPYPPISIGWDLKLVTTSTGQSLWSIDETFDSAQADVARAARDYFRSHHTGHVELGDPQADMRSPGLFSRYAAQAVTATLPLR